MIIELGHFSVILAFVMALTLGILGYASIWRDELRARAWRNVMSSLASGQLIFVAMGFLVLVYAFVISDFSVAYVASNSNSKLPWFYKVSATWGAHEGSFLLWTLIMAIWTAAVSVAGHRLPPEFQGGVVGTMGFLNFGFLLFLLATSNPFERMLPAVPIEGADLNPLLQDFGLIVHPPILYVGYIGFSVAFSYAVAALLTGRLDAAWARWSRPWTNVAWAFLTVGIALGSWWAYYELGWGGWWFWDPVENASFMPWLAGTALVHSLAVSEKRGAFKSWTVLLAIIAFSLSLVGAFIVRSGVLTSVHAFAVDPERGLFLLVLLGFVVGGSLALYGMRAPLIRSRVRYTVVSREVMLLINNLILIVSLAVVFLGTLYPIAYEALTGGDKISVGPPYFNSVFIPLMLGLASFLALAPITRWKRTPLILFKRAGWFFVAALVLGVLLPIMVTGVFKVGSVLALTLGLWIVIMHVADVFRRRRTRPAGYIGMVVAHVGFAVSLIGVGVTSEFSHSLEVRMAVGDVVEMNGVRYQFTEIRPVTGPNYIADQGEFVTDTGVTLLPEKRRYFSGNNVLTEAGIAPGIMGDLYVALGEPLPDGSWGVRLNEKPLVRWIWLGALLMAFGALLSVTDVRYRRLARRQERLSGALPA